MLNIELGGREGARKAVRRLKNKRNDLRTLVAQTDNAAWSPLTNNQKLDVLRSIVREMADRVDDLMTCQIHELRDLIDN